MNNLYENLVISRAGEEGRGCVILGMAQLSTAGVGEGLDYVYAE